MKSVVCAYYDTVAGSYSDPLYFPNHGAAKRWFKTSVLASVPKSVVNDFRLCDLGIFDRDSGVLTPHEYPVPLEVSVDDL